MSDYISEIHKLLKLGDSEERHIHGAPEALPVLDHAHEEVAPEVPAYNTAAEATMPGLSHVHLPRINVKGLLLYPVIFVMAFVFFYVVLNFPSMLAQVQGFFSKPQAQEILGADSAEYYKWIGNYFYAVGDAKLLEPTNDIDKDGLSNHDEFIIRTNPILADSDSDGFSDGIEVLNNSNFWGSGALTKNQKTLVEKLDLILVNNRISGNVAQNHAGGAVSGLETDNYDLDRPGRLSIPKLKLTVDLIWSKDPSNFDVDLTKGVVHYPGTSLPGENGIIYVSGHSSDYIWKRDPMHDVFAKLNYLSNGDDIFIDVYGKDGKVYNFRYKVNGSNVYKADDQAQFFDNSDSSRLNLSTCWPIGTSKDRLVVTAEATGL